MVGDVLFVASVAVVAAGVLSLVVVVEAVAAAVVVNIHSTRSHTIDDDGC